MKRLLAASLLPLLAAGAQATEDNVDFAASKGSAAEAQLHERLKSAVRTIPGTDTQYLIGGYVQLDGLATRKKQDGDEQDTFIVSTIPFGPADADYRLSVRQSQIDWLSRTPTPLGHIWSRLEANLFPLDGKTAPTLNQLFVRFDDWVIVGKTYSTFMDDSILPTTLDYNGPSGVTFVRQWLARGSIPFGSGWALEASVEESQADFDAGSALLSVHADARRPDLAARVRYEGDFGHLQLAGLSRSIAVTAESPLATRNRNVNGTGVSLSGSLNTFGDDTLLWQAVTGKGVGRYFNDPLSATGVALGSDQRLELVPPAGRQVSRAEMARRPRGTAVSRHGQACGLGLQPRLRVLLLLEQADASRRRPHGRRRARALRAELHRKRGGRRSGVLLAGWRAHAARARLIPQGRRDAPKARQGRAARAAIRGSISQGRIARDNGAARVVAPQTGSILRGWQSPRFLTAKATVNVKSYQDIMAP